MWWLFELRMLCFCKMLCEYYQILQQLQQHLQLNSSANAALQLKMPPHSLCIKCCISSNQLSAGEKGRCAMCAGYPRTESSGYPPGFDFSGTLSSHRSHPIWGQYVLALLQGGVQPPKVTSILKIWLLSGLYRSKLTTSKVQILLTCALKVSDSIAASQKSCDTARARNLSGSSENATAALHDDKQLTEIG